VQIMLESVSGKHWYEVDLHQGNGRTAGIISADRGRAFCEPEPQSGKLFRRGLASRPDVPANVVSGRRPFAGQDAAGRGEYFSYKERATANRVGVNRPNSSRHNKPRCGASLSRDGTMRLAGQPQTRTPLRAQLDGGPVEDLSVKEPPLRSRAMPDATTTGRQRRTSGKAGDLFRLMSADQKRAVPQHQGRDGWRADGDRSSARSRISIAPIRIWHRRRHPDGT